MLNGSSAYYHMVLFQNGIQIVEQPKSNKPDKLKLKSANGYDAIREKPDEHNTLTVKQLVVNDTTKTTKVSIGLNSIN